MYMSGVHVGCIRARCIPPRKLARCCARLHTSPQASPTSDATLAATHYVTHPRLHTSPQASPTSDATLAATHYVTHPVGATWRLTPRRPSSSTMSCRCRSVMGCPLHAESTNQLAPRSALIRSTADPKLDKKKHGKGFRRAKRGHTYGGIMELESAWICATVGPAPHKRRHGGKGGGEAVGA